MPEHPNRPHRPSLYPDIEPYDHGFLDVGDGNRVYWETCGNPEGKPAVVLHGGPGSGASPFYRRYFDPERYRIVLLDQRGAGRSTPSVSAYDTDMSVNTIPHLIADLELLRAHLGIERWLVWGGSFGCVLGLRYAQTHPHAVTELVLTGLATGSREEVATMMRGLGKVFPQAYEEFRAGVPEAERDGDLAAAYHRLLESPDAEVRERAALAWTDWETALVSLPPRSIPRYQDPVFRYGFARTVAHYWAQDHFLDGPDTVLRDLPLLKGIPGVLVQGTLDLNNLIGIPWRIARDWPDAELVMVDSAGHNAGAPGIAEHLAGAADRFSERSGPASRSGA
ncbi:prolyl aminopeptidase [Streptomyces sp. VRA16 Mangrove soil]|uniref:prolyl aminopeptidase n=1 Tax=Streptomyces sp. VRA16 Mangrove soil TaxID=2817434 RepID=UPI001A9F2ABA|nr:prolyl aminopeptidase [Streptomyces sp. VRA16 Mangrove soil]MBO1335390.1 prolyl aminopeptidase [Streptomyces sp. VRA16 Mangrove soil]